MCFLALFRASYDPQGRAHDGISRYQHANQKWRPGASGEHLDPTLGCFTGTRRRGRPVGHQCFGPKRTKKSGYSIRSLCSIADEVATSYSRTGLKPAGAVAGTKCASALHDQCERPQIGNGPPCGIKL